ncbi:MAG: hypothetical protein JWM48_626 [Mycobacterium sp.]|nr:hypothetical protein [Mycobacterium sp.]
MPLTRYGVLKAAAIDHRPAAGDDEHDHIHLVVGPPSRRVRYRAAVPTRSAQAPPDLLYLADEDFRHVVTVGLADLPDGFTRLQPKPGGCALDFVRDNLFDHSQMRAVPGGASAPDNDLGELVHHYLQRAVAAPDARVYVFGQAWGPQPETPDGAFGFRPAQGVHDVHLNQGSAGEHAATDGVRQDGALLVHLPAESRWVAVFLAFRSQAWNTDDRTGHACAPPAPGERVVRIVGALVRGADGTPGLRRVTLLNTSPRTVHIEGWRFADRRRHTYPVSAQPLPPGGTAAVAVPGWAHVDGDGILTLLDAGGRKVDGVAYTPEQARHPGWTIAF